jgi:hypothetical protein
MDDQTKTILLAVVKELVDLRANQAVIAAQVGTGVNKYDADDAKRAALKAADTFYSTLRKQIEAL